MKRSPLVVAGFVFLIVAIVHFFRVYYHWPVTIAGYSIPDSASVIALIIAVILALWMFISAAKKN